MNKNTNKDVLAIIPARKNSKGIYILRPWYEVELGVSKQEMTTLTSIVPATKSPFTINLVDDHQETNVIINRVNKRGM